MRVIGRMVKKMVAVDLLVKVMCMRVIGRMVSSVVGKYFLEERVKFRGILGLECFGVNRRLFYDNIFIMLII
jgi:hypothetical protein